MDGSHPFSPSEPPVLLPAMAEALGVDLDEAVMRGALAPEALDAATQRCAGCRNKAACRSWLGAQSAPAQGTPVYCLNTSELETLSR